MILSLTNQFCQEKYAYKYCVKQNLSSSKNKMSGYKKQQTCHIKHVENKGFNLLKHVFIMQRGVAGLAQ